jgi:hypothetical protein
MHHDKRRGSASQQQLYMTGNTFTGNARDLVLDNDNRRPLFENILKTMIKVVQDVDPGLELRLQGILNELCLGTAGYDEQIYHEDPL